MAATTSNPTESSDRERHDTSVVSGSANKPAGADGDLLNFLRKEGSASISQLVNLLGVTAPAVRQRLSRLMAEGLISRVLERQARGRPMHRYRLTAKGQRIAGDNYSDLASILWDEIRQVEDPKVRAGLLKRLAKRMADSYADGVGNGDLATKMRELTRLMAEREVPFEVDESGELPVITALACPYPDLAEQDPAICAMERMMMSEVLGETVKLSECRQSGDGCCSFAPSAKMVNKQQQ